MGQISNLRELQCNHAVIYIKNRWIENNSSDFGKESSILIELLYRRVTDSIKYPAAPKRSSQKRSPRHKHVHKR